MTPFEKCECGHYRGAHAQPPASTCSCEATATGPRHACPCAEFLPTVSNREAVLMAEHPSRLYGTPGTPAPSARVPAQQIRDWVIATAQAEAKRHGPEPRGAGCSCGFCAWSVEHVLVMSMREALRGVGFTVPVEVAL